jgi:hypothetical protein
MMNWAHGANWRRGARRQLRPSARRAAQGTGTHLVHEYRRDPRRRRTGPAQADRLHQRQKSAVKLQIWHAARRQRPEWHKTETKSILPAQRPRSSAQSLESAGPANEGEARFEQGCGHLVRSPLLYFAAVPASIPGAQDFELCLWSGGSRGTRTPGPLLANRRQHVPRRPSPQVTVLERAPASAQIRARCCTFRLYSPAGPQQSMDVAVPSAW